jgi:hypothetical protein
MKQKMPVKGMFSVQHFNKLGELVGEYKFPNGIVDEGIEHLLDVGFHGVAATATWYIGLIDNAGWTAYADADTMAAHAGWAECEAYAAATRPAWTEGEASGRAITNAATVDFAINATKTLKGIFITSDNTKGGTTGILWSTGSFTSTVSVESGDTFKVTYTISG